jgi:peptide/nickel transport system substrate-binding protein
MPRQRSRTAATAAVTAGLAAVLVAGCSSPPQESPTAGTDLAAAPRSALRDGGTLRWAVDAPPATLNAYEAAADQSTALVTAAALPRLFRLDGRGRPSPDSDFLRSAEVVAREPRQVVAYRLNPKAVWDDGRPVGAADFAAQWKALRGLDDGFWAARNAGYDRISDVSEGSDAHEVRVTFRKPYADWRSLFTPLYPRAVTYSAEAFNTSARTSLPAAAGPFAVQDVTSDGVVLVRNPRWWGARAKLDRLVLTAVPRSRRPAAIAAGQLDVAEVDPQDLGGRSAKLRVRRTLAPAYTQLTLNGGPGGVLADERVRQAVARAVDRRAVAEAVLKPLGLPAEPLGNHLVLASQHGYADHSSALGSSDAKAVRALLTEAGWRPAEAEPAAAHGREPAAPAMLKDGRPLTLRLLLPRDSATLRQVADRITAQLAAVGIKAEPVRVADESFFRDHIASGAFDLALFSWPGTAYPATDDRPVYAKPRPAADGSLSVAQNYSRVGTDRIDQLLDQAAAELDPGAARDLAARADARIWAAAGSVPLFQPPQLVALAPRVANAGAFGFATPRFQNIGFHR